MPAVRMTVHSADLRTEYEMAYRVVLSEDGCLDDCLPKTTSTGDCPLSDVTEISSRERENAGRALIASMIFRERKIDQQMTIAMKR